jgi:hypothetical protein
MLIGWLGALAIVAIIVWIAWRHPRVHSVILAIIVGVAILGGLSELFKF